MTGICTDVPIVSFSGLCQLLIVFSVGGDSKKVGAGPGFDPHFVSASPLISTFLIKALLGRCCSYAVAPPTNYGGRGAEMK